MGRQIDTPCWKELAWHRPFGLEAVWESLAHLAATSPRGAVTFEARGRCGRMHYLLCADQKYIGRVMDAFLAHGDISFHPVSGTSRTAAVQARRLKVSHPALSLKTDTVPAVVRAGLAAMAADKRGTETIIQIILGQAFAPAPVAKNIPEPNASWLSAVLGTAKDAAAESRRIVKEKAEQNRILCTIRLGVTGNNTSRLQGMFTALKTLESVGVRMYAEAENPEKLNRIHVPWHFPLELSVKELANFLMLPIGEEDLPGVPGRHPKLALTPAWYNSPTGRATARSFAMSCDAVPKKLSISPRDSLEHTILLGPTGSGKSTTMLNLVLADINAGRSVLVIDPKADLVNDILARIPDERANDVVVLDPTDPAPVGFNPLAFKDYRNPSLIADAVLSVLKELWSSSWGVRIQDILSASLLTLAGADGTTLLWLLPLLTDETFRKKTVRQVKDAALRQFWEQFEALSERDRRVQVEPVLNKLRQFLLRPGLRNVLGQAKPKFNLTDLFYKRKIVLVPLNKGQTGGESAGLLGSLIVGLTWTLALARAGLPPEKRHIVGVYIDELQDYLSLPTDLADALAQARGLGMSLTLAHQYRDQLPLDIRSGIDANARNKIIFGLNAKDAKDMAAMAPELEKEDFMMLPRYKVYTSFQYGGRNTGWIMGSTLPPPKPIRDAAGLRARSQKMYGTPAEQIEEDFLNLVNNSTINNKEMSNTPIGRRKVK